MNGYLTFLKGLSEYQQRSEIGHLLFTERWNGPGKDSSFLEEELLKMPAVAAFSKSLGVEPSSWKLELKHYAEEPDVIGTPVFGPDQCKAPFMLRYIEDEDAKNQTLTVVRDTRDIEDLVVSGMIQVADNQRALIGRRAASSTREKSCAREQLVALGIDPDTLDTVDYEAKPYKTVYQDDRKMYIFREGYEAEMAAKLAPELQRKRITDLRISDVSQQVGPVEFAGGQCTAPIVYPLYGIGYDEDGNFDKDSLGYYVEVHILAGIGNKPAGGGDIWVEDLWSRIVSIDDDPPEASIPLVVP